MEDRGVGADPEGAAIMRSARALEDRGEEGYAGELLRRYNEQDLQTWWLGETSEPQAVPGGNQPGDGRKAPKG